MRGHGGAKNGRTTDGDAIDAQFVQLLSRHRSQLLGFIFCMVRNMSDAEDVFQQTSLTLWDKFSEFESGSDFLAWANAVARNKAMTFLRSQARERARFSDQVVEELAERPLWSAEALQSRMDALAACQRKLSRADRKLLARCYGAEGTIRDVAQDIGRPVDSVYSSLSRIRRALYECIHRTLAREGRP